MDITESQLWSSIFVCHNAQVIQIGCLMCLMGQLRVLDLTAILPPQSLTLLASTASGARNNDFVTR